MNISTLKRDADTVNNNFKEVKDKLYTVKGCVIHIPLFFEEYKLATIGNTISTLGIFPIIYNDCYAVSLVNASMLLTPFKTKLITINNKQYYELTFEPGSCVIDNLNLIQYNIITYNIFDTFISKGNIPWYIKYRDLGKIFESANYFAKAKVGDNIIVNELITSFISRDPKNLHKFYRQAIKTEKDIDAIDPVFISLKNVSFSTTNTMSKISGSYFTQGLISSLVTPTEELSRVEKILRK